MQPTLELYSHHITLRHLNEKIRHAVGLFLNGLVEWDLVRLPGSRGRPRFQRAPKRIYASAAKDKQEIRLHIHHLNALEARLKAHDIELGRDIKVIKHALYTPVQIDLESISGKQLRPEQIPVVEYLSAKDEIRSKVVTAPTGSGKTLMALRSLINLGLRTVIVIKAEFIEKWIGDVEEELKLKKGDLLVVRGADQLAGLMQMALAGELHAKIIIIGNRTFLFYLKAYERDPHFSEQYPVEPEEFYRVLGAGVRLIDEVHMDFHFNFKQDTYAHIPYTISLSATLDSDQPLLNEMYRVMWPIETRGPEIVQEKYIAATCLWYKLKDPKSVRYLNHKRQYSHVELEKSIMRKPHMLKAYLQIPEMIIRSRVINHIQPGQKMLIFCSTVAMCTEMAVYLKGKFPQFSVGRYVGEDEWEALHENDIVISTIQSAGTAVDVLNLRYVLLTTALSSKQTNIQVVGRLRKLVNFPDTTPEFMFLACRDIPKHVEYAAAKQRKIYAKIKVFNQSFLPIEV